MPPENFGTLLRRGMASVIDPPSVLPGSQHGEKSCLSMPKKLDNGFSHTPKVCVDGFSHTPKSLVCGFTKEKIRCTL